MTICCGLIHFSRAFPSASGTYEATGEAHEGSHIGWDGESHHKQRAQSVPSRGQVVVNYSLVINTGHRTNDPFVSAELIILAGAY